MIKCECGCGGEMNPTDNYGRTHHFFVGHEARTRKIKFVKVFSGNEHYNWKGGRSLNQGYVMIKVKGHPRALRSNRYRVREHILVMEKHLGRYLTDNEVVHHINHIKTDNRIENLRLRTKSTHVNDHPKTRDPRTGRFIQQ